MRVGNGASPLRPETATYSEGPVFAALVQGPTLLWGARRPLWGHRDFGSGPGKPRQRRGDFGSQKARLPETHGAKSHLSSSP